MRIDHGPGVSGQCIHHATLNLKENSLPGNIPALLSHAQRRLSRLMAIRSQSRHFDKDALSL